MTVSSATNEALFIGNDVADVFPLPFRFFSNSDIIAELIEEATGNVTSMTLGIDYALTGAGDPEVAGSATGILTTTDPVATGFSLFVRRELPLTQPTDIVNQGRFYPEVHETVFDRLLMQIQQVGGDLGKALRVLPSEPAPAFLPSILERANKLLSFDALGNPVAVSPASGSASELVIDLANAADADKGAGLVGFDPALDYLPGTVGYGIKTAGQAVKVTTRVLLKALDTANIKIAHLTESGRAGVFVWNDGVFSSQIALDTQEGVFIKADAVDAAAGAWVRSYDGNGVIDTWFGVNRTGTGATTGPNSTVNLQAAIDFCYSQSKDLLLSAGTTFVSDGAGSGGLFALLNQGVSMLGLPSKATLSIIKPLSSMSATADFIRFRPVNNSGQDFIRFENFMIQPKPAATAYGKRALYCLFDLITNVGQMRISRLYLNQGNDYSIRMENSIPTNAQGNPSNSVIEECSLWEGVYMSGAGDNISIRDNFIVTSVGSAREGIYIYQVDGGGGVASFVDITRNAMNANGSAILVDRARNLQVTKNNIEHSAGSGVNASVINLRGSGGVLSMPVVENNAIGVFGASTALNGINVGSGNYFAQILRNNIITDVVRNNAIIVAGTNTRVTSNKVSPAWTNNLNDGGTGTIGSDFVESGI